MYDHMEDHRNEPKDWSPVYKQTSCGKANLGERSIPGFSLEKHNEIGNFLSIGTFIHKSCTIYVSNLYPVGHYIKNIYSDILLNCCVSQKRENNTEQHGSEYVKITFGWWTIPLSISKSCVCIKTVNADHQIMSHEQSTKLLFFAGCG